MTFAMSDEALGTFVPIVVYWVYSGMYEMMGSLKDSYRLFPKEEEDKKNLVSRWETLRGVLLNQSCTVAVLMILFTVTGKAEEGGAAPRQLPLLVQAAQFLVAMLVLDFWEYFGHRLFHTNRFLYRHIHSKHHHLVVPYAWGAQYQHPLEVLFLDTLGYVVSFLASGMTPRAGILFFSFALVKTVDDHCGLWFPAHPFHRIFPNNSAFHIVHHQLYGGKSNFSGPFFVFWDRICGTYMPYALEKREGGGGFELVPTTTNTTKED